MANDDQKKKGTLRIEDLGTIADSTAKLISAYGMQLFAEFVKSDARDFIADGRQLFAYCTQILDDIHETQGDCETEMNRLPPNHPSRDVYQQLYNTLGEQEERLKKKMSSFGAIARSQIPIDEIAGLEPKIAELDQRIAYATKDSLDQINDIADLLAPKKGD